MSSIGKAWNLISIRKLYESLKISNKYKTNCKTKSFIYNTKSNGKNKFLQSKRYIQVQQQSEFRIWNNPKGANIYSCTETLFIETSIEHLSSCLPYTAITTSCRREKSTHVAATGTSSLKSPDEPGGNSALASAASGGTVVKQISRRSSALGGPGCKLEKDNSRLY